MKLPKVEDIEIVQGSQFVKSAHWYGGGKTYDTIDGVAVGHPTIITVTGHQLPSTSPTPISIDGIKGTARVLNTGPNDCDMVLATYIDANSFSVPVPTVGKVYTSGTGYIEWYKPKDLTNYTARMQIRGDVDDTATLVSLTSPGDIAISLTDARITVTIATSVTEALDFDNAVYDLELVDASSEATRILEGEVELRKEVTR
jgi:hypothetical protein